MDLGSGRVIVRPKVTPMKMTDLVVNHVNNMAKRQGIKSMKFYNRKRKQILFTPADLLEGVGSKTRNKNVLIDDNREHANFLPVPGGEEDLPGELSSEHELDMDDEVDENEVAELVEDARIHEDIQVQETVDEDQNAI